MTFFTRACVISASPLKMAPSSRPMTTSAIAISTSGKPFCSAPGGHLCAGRYIAARVMLLLAQLADRGELRGEHRQLALDRGDLLLVLRLGAGFLGLLQRLVRLGLVQVGAPDRGVGEQDRKGTRM